jgi:hypothetical protein
VECSRKHLRESRSVNGRVSVPFTRPLFYNSKSQRWQHSTIGSIVQNLHVRFSKQKEPLYETLSQITIFRTCMSPCRGTTTSRRSDCSHFAHWLPERLVCFAWILASYFLAVSRRTWGLSEGLVDCVVLGRVTPHKHLRPLSPRPTGLPAPWARSLSFSIAGLDTDRRPQPFLPQARPGKTSKTMHVFLTLPEVCPYLIPIALH